MGGHFAKMMVNLSRWCNFHDKYKKRLLLRCRTGKTFITRSGVNFYLGFHDKTSIT